MKEVKLGVKHLEHRSAVEWLKQEVGKGCSENHPLNIYELIDKAFEDVIEE